MAPGKGGDDKDNPLHFSGEVKDWPTFKAAIQCRADARDTTWLLESGRALALFFARQIKDKTGSGATRKKALERENVKKDNNHVPTSVGGRAKLIMSGRFEWMPSTMTPKPSRRSALTSVPQLTSTLASSRMPAARRRPAAGCRLPCWRPRRQPRRR